MASLGYTRVSTVEQNADLQIRALDDAGCLKVYTNHGVGGTKARRPQLENLLEPARAGDELVVRKRDRLGQNTRQLLDLVDHLDSEGIHFRSLNEGIATTGPMGKAMLTVMSDFAQLERDQLAERT
ncbi:recombinase family protein [Microbacterium sp. A93]|uniref:recombinase family protein n=1 Tax=Microbacterium sp. A93 TaxID=3450716 RepID=UPI003F43453A